jgi:adenylate cyclase, class 2
MSGHEIEAKFYVRNLAGIEARLCELKARLIQPRAHERNIRFDTPNHNLGKEGRALRLRQDDQVRMTYKGPSAKREGVLSRIEIEFALEDFQKAEQLLEALGYEKIFFYEKYRATYELTDTHVMLDELPYGEFVEIEGKSIEAIREIAERLRLKWDAALGASYHALFERVCNARGLDPAQLTFAAFEESRPGEEELAVVAAD